MSTETATIAAVDTVPNMATAVEDITTIHTTTEARHKITTTIMDLLLGEEEAGPHLHEAEIARITTNQLHKICSTLEDHEDNHP